MKYKNKLKDYYVNKIVDAWIKHKKIIICVDFDNTIYPWEDFEEPLCNTVVSTIKEVQRLGAYTILYTCREGVLLDKALSYCDHIGLYFDDINPSIPFKSNYSIKPYCNIMLDDKAGLIESLETLQKACLIYKKLYESKYKQRS